jgi:hypothetical protein
MTRYFTYYYDRKGTVALRGLFKISDSCYRSQYMPLESTSPHKGMWTEDSWELADIEEHKGATEITEEEAFIMLL